MIPALSVTMIRTQTTDTSFERGQAYYQGGNVGPLVQRGNVLQAAVEGSDYEPYQVRLTFDEGGIRDASCTCPYDYPGWCKHIVAVALACLHRPEQIERREPINAQLAELNRDQLLHLLQTLVETEPVLTDVIEQQLAQIKLTAPVVPTAPAPTAPPPRRTPVDAQSYRRQVSQLVGGLGHMRASEAYWHVGGTVNQVGQLLTKAQEFLDGGDPENALAVFEAVVDEYVKHWFEMDDSDGEGSDFFYELDKPLTEILLSLELPDKERKRWQRLLNRWAKEVGEYGVDDPFDMAREVLQTATTVDELIAQGVTSPGLVDLLLNIVERRGETETFLELAQQSGNTLRYTQKLATLGRTAEAVSYALAHLANAESALALAQTLREQGAFAEALVIGERGLALEGQKAALATWLRDLAQSLGKETLALVAARVAFRTNMGLETYQRLQEIAATQWPTEREAALTLIRSGGHQNTPGAIEVLLHEKLVSDAIALLDRQGSYYGYDLLGKVVEAAISVNPDWAIRQSLRQAEEIINPGKADRYHYAVEWLRRARDAWRASGRAGEWQSYLDQLRTGPHGRKYKLMELLKGIGR